MKSFGEVMRSRPAWNYFSRAFVNQSELSNEMFISGEVGTIFIGGEGIYKPAGQFVSETYVILYELLNIAYRNVV